MAKKLVNELSFEILCLKLKDIREKVNKTFFKDDKFFQRNALMDEIQSIKLEYNQICDLPVEDILFYLNYNTKC